jgi:hypothetical protein
VYDLVLDSLHYHADAPTDEVLRSYASLVFEREDAVSDIDFDHDASEEEDEGDDEEEES